VVRLLLNLQVLLSILLLQVVVVVVLTEVVVQVLADIVVLYRENLLAVAQVLKAVSVYLQAQHTLL
jgi:hypothetical protein